jgi:hypothetical protein
MLIGLISANTAYMLYKQKNDDRDYLTKYIMMDFFKEAEASGNAAYRDKHLDGIMMKIDTGIDQLVQRYP